MSTENFVTSDTVGVDVSTRTIGRQPLRVGVRAARNGEPPIILFNGIGCSIELFTPLVAVLDRFARSHGAQWHALRTRQAAARRFVSVHVLVPGAWTVQQGHDLCEAIEVELAAVRPPTTVFTHLEPLEDPASFADQALDRLPPEP